MFPTQIKRTEFWKELFDQLEVTHKTVLEDGLSIEVDPHGQTFVHMKVLADAELISNLMFKHIKGEPDV